MSPHEAARRMTDSLEQRVVVVSRDRGRCARLERLIPTVAHYASSVAGMLAVVRDPPRAVVLDMEHLQGRERALVESLRRANPDVPIYVLVRPEDEWAARDLVRAGAADYFLLHDGLRGLSAALFSPAPETETQQEPSERDTSADPRAEPESKPASAERDTEVHPEEPQPPGPNAARLFDAACELTRIALGDSDALLREGAQIILSAIEAGRACAFAWNPETRELELCAAVGAPAEPRTFETERAFAERTVRTGEALLVGATGSADARPAMAPLLCIPVRQADETFGVVCLSGKADGSPVTAEDQGALEPLVGALGRLCRAVHQRDKYARLALRDSETGVLKAETFRTYLEKLLKRAAQHDAEVGLALVEPDASPDGGEPSSEVLARLGRTIQRSLPPRGRAGRLSPGRFAAAWSRRVREGEEPEAASAAHRAMMEGLSAVGPQTDASLRLRTGLAVFPHDGTDAEGLLAAAEARLTGSA